MIRLCFLFYLLLMIISYVQTQNSQCPNCEPDKCSAVLNCQYGDVLDECNCCKVCGKGDNEVCDDIINKCGATLVCNFTAIGNEQGIPAGSKPNTTGICTKSQKLPITPDTINPTQKTEDVKTTVNHDGHNHHESSHDATTQRSTLEAQNTSKPSNSAQFYLKVSALLCCLLLSISLH